MYSCLHIVEATGSILKIPVRPATVKVSPSEDTILSNPIDSPIAMKVSPSEDKKPGLLSNPIHSPIVIEEDEDEDAQDNLSSTGGWLHEL